MTIKIDERYMEESLREFVEELLPDAGINPDTFIIVAAEGDDLTFCTSSNDHKRTMDVLKQAVILHTESKLEESEK